MATINRRGRTWQLNWSDAAGQHRISLGPVSRQEAEIARREKELELLTGRSYSRGGLTLAMFAPDYLRWFASTYPSTAPRTEGILRLQLIPTFGHLALDEITAIPVSRWIEKRQAEVSPGTLRKEYNTLHSALQVALDWDAIGRHPLAGFTAPHDRADAPPEFYTPEDLQRLYGASGDLREAWRFMANTGLRRNEALNLVLSDVLPDRVVVRSTNRNPTKSRRWREVPLNDAARTAAEALRADRTRGPLLPHMVPRSLSRAFIRDARKAGLPGSIHSLRHSFVSALVMAGVDLETVRRLAGHQVIATTLKYAHLAPGHAKNAVGRISL